MGTEVELAYLANWNELIRLVQIVVPALITGGLGFLLARLEYSRRLSTQAKEQEFKARELLFNYNRERLNDLKDAQSSMEKALGETAGSSFATFIDAELQPEFAPVLGELLNTFTKEINGNIKYILRNETEREHYPEYEEALMKYQEGVDELLTKNPPANPEELMHLYNYLREAFICVSGFSSRALEYELKETIAPYLKQ